MGDCFVYILEQTQRHALVKMLINLRIISKNATTSVYNNCQLNMLYEFVHVPSIVYLYNLQIVIKGNMELIVLPYVVTVLGKISVILLMVSAITDAKMDTSESDVQRVSCIVLKNPNKECMKIDIAEFEVNQSNDRFNRELIFF